MTPRFAEFSFALPWSTPHPFRANARPHSPHPSRSTVVSPRRIPPIPPPPPPSPSRTPPRSTTLTTRILIVRNAPGSPSTPPMPSTVHADPSPPGDPVRSRSPTTPLSSAPTRMASSTSFIAGNPSLSLIIPSYLRSSPPRRPAPSLSHPTKYTSRPVSRRSHGTPSASSTLRRFSRIHSCVRFCLLHALLRIDFAHRP